MTLTAVVGSYLLDTSQGQLKTRKMIWKMGGRRLRDLF
jgi:hypothetical protein